MLALAQAFAHDVRNPSDVHGWPRIVVRIIGPRRSVRASNVRSGCPAGTAPRRNLRWTTEEENLHRELAGRGMTAHQIALRLRRERIPVRTRAKELGITLRISLGCQGESDGPTEDDAALRCQPPRRLSEADHPRYCKWPVGGAFCCGVSFSLPIDSLAIAKEVGRNFDQGILKLWGRSLGEVHASLEVPVAVLVIHDATSR
jgi:hypothetical protein